MILDNGQFHKANKLSVPTNVELAFLPPYSPELNPVERLWQDLKDQLAFDFHEHLSSTSQVSGRRPGRSSLAIPMRRSLP